MPLRAAAALLVLLPLLLQLRPADQVVDRPLTEDAYYAFTIARNVADGRGVTIDGASLTNGFQPLFTFLCAVPHVLAGGNSELAVRLVLLLSWVIHLLSGTVTGAVCRNLSPGSPQTAWWCGFVVYVSAAFPFWQHYNGLETGAVGLFYLLGLLLYQSIDLRNRVAAIGFGGLLGLLVLCRIDAAVFVVLLVGVTALRGSWAAAAAIALASGIVSSPWWIYNAMWFGSLMPSSGLAQQSFGLTAARLLEALHALSVNLSPFFYLFGSASWAKTAIYLAIAIVTYALFRIHTPGALQDAPAATRHRTAVFCGAIVVSAVLLSGWYAYSSWAAHFYRRYTFPLSIPSVIVAALLFLSLYQRYRVVQRLAPLGLVLPVLTIVGALLFVPDQLPGNPHLAQLRLVQRVVDPSARVGAWQSGTLGYFRANVVNLDGKVNMEALRHQGRMDAYIRAQDVDVLCDWPALIRQSLGFDPEGLGWPVLGEADTFIVVGVPPESTTTVRTPALRR